MNEIRDYWGKLSCKLERFFISYNSTVSVCNDSVVSYCYTCFILIIILKSENWKENNKNSQFIRKRRKMISERRTALRFEFKWLYTRSHKFNQKHDFVPTLLDKNSIFTNSLNVLFLNFIGICLHLYQPSINIKLLCTHLKYVMKGGKNLILNLKPSALEKKVSKCASKFHHFSYSISSL